MISNETIKEVKERSAGRCENFDCRTSLQLGYENHHIYWRSQYRRSDRDERWNIAALCRNCHRSIHSGGNTTLDKNLKLIATGRKQKEHRDDSGVSATHPDIIRARKGRRSNYRKKVKKFKEEHDGLSPSQVDYRRQKAYCASLPK